MNEENQPPNKDSTHRCFLGGILPLTPLDGGSDPMERECYEATKKKQSSRIMTVNVRLLDDTIKTFHVQYKASGQVLFDQVCRVLNLLESDYFGLEYRDDQGARHWLDYEKSMCNQLGMKFEDAFLEFCVKFYTPDPGQLEEEFTRYLFSLQIKRDLAQGQLLVHEDTAAVLASYIVQASCGDFSHDDYPDASYLACHQFVPRQSKQLEEKIMLHHMNHIGQSPSEADMNLLEVARRCEFFGVRLVPAFDSEGIALTMAVGHVGIVVYRNSMKIHTFSWNKIRKLSFKRRKFLIKLHPTEGYGCYGKDCVEFLFDSRNASKSFWKRCIEHHAFFRCTEVRKTCRVRGKTRIFSRGSSFRYSGRTQKQVIEYVRETSARRRSFQRSSSLRLANPVSYPTSGVTSSYSCSSMTQLRGDQPTGPGKNNNNEEFTKTAVCLSEPNTPQHRGNISGDNIDKDDTISHESYHILNQSLDEPTLNTSFPLDTSRVHDRSHDSDESPIHRRAQSKSPEPRVARLPRSRDKGATELTRQGSIECNEIPYTLHYRRESNPRLKIRRHKSQPREPRSRYRTSPEHPRLCRSSSEKRPKVNFARWGELPPVDSYSSRDDSVDGTFESEIRERWTELRRQKERMRARQLWQQRSEIEKSLEAEEASEPDEPSHELPLQPPSQLPPAAAASSSSQTAQQSSPPAPLSPGSVQAGQPPDPDDILQDFNRAQMLGEAGPDPRHRLTSTHVTGRIVEGTGAGATDQPAESDRDLGARLEHLEGNLEEIELLKELELEAVQQECQRLEETLAMNTELKEEYERVLKSEGAEVMTLLQSLNDTSAEQQQEQQSPLMQQQEVSPAASVSSESLVSPPKLNTDDDDDSQEDDFARKDLPYSEQSADSERDTAPLQPLDRSSQTSSATATGAFSEQGDDFSASQSSHIPQVDVRDGYAACLQSLILQSDPPLVDPGTPARPPHGVEHDDDENDDDGDPMHREKAAEEQILQTTLSISQEFCAEIEEFLATIPGPSGAGREDPTSETFGATSASSRSGESTEPSTVKAPGEQGASHGERQIEATPATSSSTSTGLTFVVESLGSPDKAAPSSQIPHSSSSSSSSGTPPMGRVFVKIKKKRLFAKPEDVSDVSSSSSEIRLTLDEFEFLRREIGKGRKIGQIIPESLISSSEDVTFSDETETVFVGDEPKTLCNSPVANPHTPIPDPEASLRLSKSSSEESSLDCANEPHNTAGLDLNLI